MGAWGRGINSKSTTMKGGSMKEGDYVIVRTYSAGVFAGTLRERNGKEVTLHNARRIWYWAGAASLSQLAQSGTSKPNQCKFPEPNGSHRNNSDNYCC
jgi:hypothetical protein